MEFKITDSLKVETDVPILNVGSFRFFWKTNCHARMELDGYIDRSISWNPAQSYNSRIKIHSNEGGKTQTLFYGYIFKVEISNSGKTTRVFLDIMSASCLLDRMAESRSFQNPAKTYGEVVKLAVQADGGQVIRIQESDREIGSPVIRYEETVWQFAGRMADRLGSCIIPDIETGNPNIWFGMRKGKEVQAPDDTQYTARLRPIGKKAGICIKTEGRNYYKLGDRMTCLGQKMIITEIEGRYEHGELIFTYTMEDKATKYTGFHEYKHSAGMGLWGTIADVKKELVKVVLDIDKGEDTGDYYYPWYPETGNTLYAMPEIGSRALLYFFSEDEQDGAVIHCLNKEHKSECYYKNRALNTKDGNTMELTNSIVSFSRDGHTLSLSNDTIHIGTLRELNIYAEENIRLKAKKIVISTPEEIKICQG